MRITIDLPEALYRHIKVRAALEGVPVRALVGILLQRGLAVADTPVRGASARSAPPTVEVTEPFPLSAPCNAALFELLEEPDASR